MSDSKVKNGILEGVIWKQLLLFFFPIMIGSFFQQLYNTADALILGREVGKEALAAVGGDWCTYVVFAYTILLRVRVYRDLFGSIAWYGRRGSADGNYHVWCMRRASAVDYDCGKGISNIRGSNL